ncbi:ATP-binding protein, partial [Magnetococcales bacterium HHB-1]
PPLAIIDYYMPDGNGDELTQALLNDPRTHNTLVVMHSQRTEIVEQALSAGAIDLIYKDDPHSVFIKRVCAMRRFIQSQKRQHYYKLEAQQKQLLDCVNKAQTNFISRMPTHTLFDQLLTEILELTQSRFGVICMFKQEADQPPHLQTLALSNIAWDRETLKFYNENAKQGIQFNNLNNLLGAVVLGGESILTNNPTKDPRYGGLPKGHPELINYLGLPLRGKNEQVVGLIGLANRPQGYLPEIITYLQPVRSATAMIITGYQNLEQRRLTEIELRKAKQTADAANRAKSEFLATMSHEIRTPMNAILGMAEVLIETPLTEKQYQYLSVLSNSAEKLLFLLNDILDFSKVEAKKIRLDFAPFDLGALIEQIADIMRIRALEKELILITCIAPEITDALIGDAYRIHQIIINLVSNAIKFTESGSIAILVRQKKYHDDQILLEFTVQDTGIGISPKHLKTIFQSFQQADSSTTRKYGGTGLGLAISKRLVELMQGEITVQSQLEEGSSFSFTLPVKKASPSEISIIQKQVQQLKKIHILIKYDHLFDLQFLGALKRTKAVIHMVKQDRPLLQELDHADQQNRPYHCVIYFIKQKTSFSFEEMENLRQRKRYQNLPVFIRSALSRAQDHRKLHQLNICRFNNTSTAQAMLQELSSALDANASELRPLAPRPLETNRLRILLAEDSDDNALLVKTFLKSTNYSLDRVVNGREAVDQVTNNTQRPRYDLILMDVQMPIMDGLQATKEIRAWEKARGILPITIVTLTANAMPEDLKKSQQAGCNGHLTKPIKKKYLLNKITEFTLI